MSHLFILVPANTDCENTKILANILKAFLMSVHATFPSHLQNVVAHFRVYT